MSCKQLSQTKTSKEFTKVLQMMEEYLYFLFYNINVFVKRGDSSARFD